MGRPQRANEVLEEALAAARATDDKGSLSSQLGTVAEALVKAGKAAEAEQVLEEALAAARKFPFVTDPSLNLRHLAPVLVKVGKTEELLAAASEIQNPDLRHSVLLRVAEALAEARIDEAADQAFAAALDAARAQSFETPREHALSQTVEALAKAGGIDQALAAAPEIKSLGYRCRTLNRIGTDLAKAGRREEAASVVSKN